MGNDSCLHMMTILHLTMSLHMMAILHPTMSLYILTLLHPPKWRRCSYTDLCMLVLTMSSPLCVKAKSRWWSCTRSCTRVSTLSCWRISSPSCWGSSKTFDSTRWKMSDWRRPSKGLYSYSILCVCVFVVREGTEHASSPMCGRACVVY